MGKKKCDENTSEALDKYLCDILGAINDLCIGQSMLYDMILDLLRSINKHLSEIKCNTNPETRPENIDV